MTQRREELARRRAQAGFTQESLAERLQIARATVARWERGEGGLPYPRHRPGLAQALGVSAEELELLFGVAHDVVVSRASMASSEASRFNRRHFVSRASEAPGIGLGATNSLVELIDRLGATITHGDDQREVQGSADHAIDLTQMLVTIKQAYQACDYDVISRYLPEMVRRLEETPEVGLIAVDRLRAQTYHVLASVLFKLGADAAAIAGAEASMAAAQQSDDLLAICSSGRILVQALDSSGQHQQAAELSMGLAENTERQLPSARRADPIWLSVYGSLLLRGAMAAASAEDPDLSAHLLDEADETATLLGTDGNYYWTAFGPTNVLAHRVAAEYTLGNVGRAVQVYRCMDLARLGTAERKTTVLLDVGRSFVVWSKFDEAMECLTRAEQLGPQEFRRRPTTHQTVRMLQRVAPRSQQRAVAEMASRVGLGEVA